MGKETGKRKDRESITPKHKNKKGEDMEGYLGETHLKAEDTRFKDYEAKDWAKLWIYQYGGIDGAHHKTWVLDQVARILSGTEVKIKLAKWENGHEEYRFTLDEPSEEYLEFVRNCKDGEDGEDTYDYDEGIAP